MAATIASSGTWTALSTDIAKFRAGGVSPAGKDFVGNPGANTPGMSGLVGTDFQLCSDEVMQFIERIMDGYGSIPGSAGNVRLNFWPAATMLKLWVNSLFDGSAASTPSTYSVDVRAAGV